MRLSNLSILCAVLFLGGCASNPKEDPQETSKKEPIPENLCGEWVLDRVDSSQGIKAKDFRGEFNFPITQESMHSETTFSSFKGTEEDLLKVFSQNMHLVKISQDGSIGCKQKPSGMKIGSYFTLSLTKNETKDENGMRQIPRNLILTCTPTFQPDIDPVMSVEHVYYGLYFTRVSDVLRDAVFPDTLPK